MGGELKESAEDCQYRDSSVLAAAVVYCLDRIHSTGAAEVKRRSVMMGGSAPRALSRRESWQATLIVGQGVADEYQGRSLTLPAALPARGAVHIPGNGRSGVFFGVAGCRRCLFGEARKGPRGAACPLGCQVSFNETAQ